MQIEYISVKEAASKFGLSERRVQKLCETNRIDGCYMVSGVWLIPVNAKKPSDERTMGLSNDTSLISLKELCDMLSISTATGRNWIRLGKLKAEYVSKKTAYFSMDYAEALKKEIQSGVNTSLKSRRNKKFISGNSLYYSYVYDNSKNIDSLQKLLNLAKKDSITFTLAVIQYLVADCALHLFSQKNNYIYGNDHSLLLKYLRGEFVLNEYSELIDSMIAVPEEAIVFCNQHPLLFDLEYTYEPNEDILGLIYISCKNVGNRKANGLYYTPTKIVQKLISLLDIKANDKLLDPCCGTGNFLLQLPDMIPFDSIYGNDIDSISVKIARLNMALRYTHLSTASIIEHITEVNFLFDYKEKDYQYIIGNPPWGYEFSDNEKTTLRKMYTATSGKSIESYDLFIEKALQTLSANGQLLYVVPEAILNVKAHTAIRYIIMQFNSIKYIEFLGNIFDGVQCPCIILQLQHTNLPLSTKGMMVCSSEKVTTICTERKIDTNNFSFLTTDDEYNILKKIRNVSSAKLLAGNADFALGIVTGNNKKYISYQKADNNELILNGSDICKYHIKPTNKYIVFKPESFQQTAPTSMYRAPEKLLYRFISNQLVFAYDDKQTLSLNSCNIVIPKIKGAKIKYVLAILNSRIAQFIFKKEYNSVKVLRSHIEIIPIPIISEAQQNAIIELVDKLTVGLPLPEAQKTYDTLDQLIFDIFNLTRFEQKTIIKAVDEDNKFLV